MRLRTKHTSKPREPDLTSLINVVFLILIFFLVAGALRPFSARDISLAKTQITDTGPVAPGRLILYQDGRVRLGGDTLDVADLGTLADRLAADTALDTSAAFTIVADKDVDAQTLLVVTRILQSAGLKSIAVMTERQRP